MSFDDLVLFVSGDLDSRMQAAYIACCCLALVLCLRPWALVRSRADAHAKPGNEIRIARSTHGFRHRAQEMGEKGRAWMEGPGPGAVLHMLVFAGTATAALIGWRIPAEIERLYGDGAGFGLIFPNVTMPTIGRLAQVIGALAFAVVALRFLRLLIPVFAVLAAITLLILAIQYVAGVRFLI